MILAANHLLLLNGSKRNSKFKYRNSKMKFGYWMWIGEDTNHGQMLDLKIRNSNIEIRK